MSDRELLELAAKAAGLQVCTECGAPGCGWIIIGTGVGDLKVWNPLEDDNDAMRLAVNLNLQPLFNDDLETVTVDYQSAPRQFTVLCEQYGCDKYYATRRAIVRAAAEIGKSIP